MSTDNLSPCPFCGTKTIDIKGEEYKQVIIYYAYCFNCQARGPETVIQAKTLRTQEVIIAAIALAHDRWNSRKDTADLEAFITYLQGKLT